MFVDALSLHEEDGVWVLELDAEAVWIDDGMPQHSMLDDLLASPKAQTAKDGSRFLVVPFQHSGKGPTEQTSTQQALAGALKGAMKQRKIPWAKIEKDDQGRPLLGRLHGFDVSHAPLKGSDAVGHRQGWGAVGDVMQGPGPRQLGGIGGAPGGGTPFLQGVSVYQHQGDDGKVKRSVMTFRVASSKHRGEGRWEHPGLPPVHIIDDTYDWAQKTFDEDIAPRIVADIMAKL
jgi:hypothetical protein